MSTGSSIRAPDVPATLQETKTLGTGVTLSDGVAFVGSAYFQMTNDNPGSVYKWSSIFDLSSPSSAAFPSDGNHASAGTLVYVSSTGLLYTCFGTFIDGGTNFYASKLCSINPSSLAITEIANVQFVDSGVGPSQGIPKLATDGSMLYMLTSPSTGDSILLKLDPTNGEETTRTTFSSRGSGQTVTYDPGTSRLYCAGTTNPFSTKDAWVGWVASSFGSQNVASLSSGFSVNYTSLVYGGFMYVGDEESAPLRLAKVPTDLSSVTLFQPGGGLANAMFSVALDPWSSGGRAYILGNALTGTQQWGCCVVYDLGTGNTVEVITMPNTTFRTVNAITLVGSQLLIATYDNTGAATTSLGRFLLSSPTSVSAVSDHHGGRGAGW